VLFSIVIALLCSTFAYSLLPPAFSLGHFTEHDAAIIIRDLISGLHALHEHDILHLDIKPENLLFDSMGDDAKIKITDFGLSKLFSDSQNNQKTKFSMQLMEDRLKTLLETGKHLICFQCVSYFLIFLYLLFPLFLLLSSTNLCLFLPFDFLSLFTR
jgi:serine/threonine protein kinase